MEENKKQPQNQMNVSINLDQTPILYTDNVFMSINEDGVMFDFTQKMGPTNQLRVVARVGMSKEHARKLVKSLEALLLSSAANQKAQTGETVLN
jgi:hypothetical protein